MRLNAFVSVGILLAVVAASLDFVLFFTHPHAAFFVHNTLAVGMGMVLTICGSILWKRERHCVLHLGPLLMGITMISVHLTKMQGGKCF